MLALFRTTRGAREISRHVRTLTAIAPSASSPDAGAAEQPHGTLLDETTVTRKRQSRRLAHSGAECMFVSPWNGIRSSAEGLAIAHALQEKYGPAKEVIFPRDQDNITTFQPYFWLVFDNADVRKRLPEDSAQIRVRVEDPPKGDGNVGVEEMVRALGLSKDRGPSLQPQLSAEGEGEGTEETADASDGYKDLDVRVEWARSGPNEVFLRRRSNYEPLRGKLIPGFAAAWVAFDGFSPEAARGAHTPNLLRAREKWRILAPQTSDPSPAETPAPAPDEAGAEPTPAEDVVNVTPREWVPIIPRSPSSTPLPIKSEVAGTHTTDNFAPTTVAAAPSTTHPPPPPPLPSSLEPASTETSASPKMSRRERILLLARQNAQTPLPELAEQPQPVAEAEKIKEESEQEEKERTIRERLWRLVGRNY